MIIRFRYWLATPFRVICRYGEEPRIHFPGHFII